MDAKFPFRFSLPIIPDGQIMTAGDAERRLLREVYDKRAQFEDAVWQLARLYSMTDRQNEAYSWVQTLMTLTSDPDRQALYYLTFGQLMEQKKDYQSATDFYGQALALNPTQTKTRYLPANNLGYSLNQLGYFAEAEPFCRTAIKVDPHRYNAYKNLGVALEGQGQTIQAAEAYLEALERQASDPRALNHLKELVKRHPEILRQRPDLKERLCSDEKAVGLATKAGENIIQNKVGDPPPRLGNAARILEAVAHLIFHEGQQTFTREEVRRQIKVSREEWMSGYTAIFQAMRIDQPGGAPKIRKEYRGVFLRVSRGVYKLTDYGRQYLQSGNWRVVYMA